MIEFLRRLPTWALVAGAVFLGAVIVLGFLSTVWLGLALVVIVAIVLAGAWAWIELPSAYDHGPDRAERAQQERYRRMMEEE